MVEIGIVKDDIGGFPTQFENGRLQRSRRGNGDPPSRFRGAHENDLSNGFMLDGGLSACRAKATEDIDETFWQSGFFGQSSQSHGGQRGELARLDDHAVARGDGGRNLPAGREDGGVPRL